MAEKYDMFSYFSFFLSAYLYLSQLSHHIFIHICSGVVRSYYQQLCQRHSLTQLLPKRAASVKMSLKMAINP